MAIRIVDVKITNNNNQSTSFVGQNFKIEIKVSENNWLNIKDVYSTWNDIKLNFTSWLDVKNY